MRCQVVLACCVLPLLLSGLPPTATAAPAAAAAPAAPAAPANVSVWKRYCDVGLATFEDVNPDANTPFSHSRTAKAARYYCGVPVSGRATGTGPPSLHHDCFMPQSGHKTGSHFNYGLLNPLNGVVGTRTWMAASNLHNDNGDPQRHLRSMCAGATRVQFVWEGLCFYNVSTLAKKPGTHRSLLRFPFVRDLSSIVCSSVSYHAIGYEAGEGPMAELLSYSILKHTAPFTTMKLPPSWRAYAAPPERQLSWMALSNIVEDFLRHTLPLPRTLPDLRSRWQFYSAPRATLRLVALLEMATHWVQGKLARWLIKDLQLDSASEYGKKSVSMFYRLAVKRKDSRGVRGAFILETLRMLVRQRGLVINLGYVTAAALADEPGPWQAVAGDSMLRSFHMEDEQVMQYLWLLGVPVEKQQVHAAVQRFLHPQKPQRFDGKSANTGVRAYVDAEWAKWRAGLHLSQPITEALPHAIVALSHRLIDLVDELHAYVELEGLLDTPLPLDA